MDVEGSLTVRLDWDGRRVRRASVRSTRPLAAPRALVGRDVREAATMLPLLYSVCALAQGAAAASALAIAAGEPAAEHDLGSRSVAVTLEALQEDLRRLLIDIPAAAGLPGRVEPVSAVRRAVAPLLAALRAAGHMRGEEVVALGARLRSIVAAEALGVAPAAFLALRDSDGFVAWSTQAVATPARVVRHILDDAPRLGASDVRAMPEATSASVSAAVLAALDADPAFARAPRWNGAVAETGALARAADHPGLAAFAAAHGNGVAARLVARLIEVARSVEALAAGRDERRVAAWSLRAAEGVASVHTARGLLVHRARVAKGRVTDYAIVAPTEWNFHPQGALVRGLEGIDCDDATVLAHRANLVVQALDPCVACSVEIRRA